MRDAQPALGGLPALDGWSVLVTGGGSGIGLACAQRLAADGAAVTLCGRSAARLARAALAVRSAGVPADRVRVVAADVTDEDEVAAAVAVAAAPLAPGGGRRLDAVVLSAGGSETLGPLTCLDAADWRRTFDVNVTGAWLTIKAAAPVMVELGRGSMVAVSSLVGVVTHRYLGAYGPSKAALDSLCRLAADELGPSGIRVNAVRPGWTRTDLVAPILASAPVLDDVLACAPLGRVGEVGDVAAAVRFLVGPEAPWITGQALGVDGGHGLRRGTDLTPVMAPVYGPDALRGAAPAPVPAAGPG